MLPSTGLFKSVLCPYFDSVNSRCLRPYCHYKHATKKDEEPEQPVYIPTPKTQPPKLLTLGEPLTKKSKLEYIPTKPQINDGPQNKNYESNSDNVPVYVPSNTININISKIDKINLDDCAEELDMLSEVIEAEFSEHEDDENIVEETVDKLIKNKKEITTNETLDKLNGLDSSNKKYVVKSDNENKSSSKEHSKTNGHHSSSSHKRDRYKSSSSSSSRHKYRKSSLSDKDSKEKSSDKNREKHSSSSSKSKSSSSHRRSSGSSSHKNTSKEKDRESSRHKSSKSSSSSKRKLSPCKKEDEIVETKKNFEFDIAYTNLESSDEDDIEAQCKLIFDQFTPAQNDSQTSVQDMNKTSLENQKRKSSTDIDEASLEDVTKKEKNCP